MIPEILTLLLRPEALITLAGALFTGWVYLKGRKHAKDAAEAEQRLREAKLLKRLEESDVKNKEIRENLDRELEDVNKATDQRLLDKFLRGPWGRDRRRK